MVGVLYLNECVVCPNIQAPSFWLRTKTVSNRTIRYASSIVRVHSVIAWGYEVQVSVIIDMWMATMNGYHYIDAYNSATLESSFG